MARSKNVPYGQGRDELMVAAITLIGERGVHALTMRQVAAEAKLVVGALSHHFPSRAVLINTAFNDYVRQTEDVVATAITRATAADTTSEARNSLAGAIRTIHADPRAVMIRTELRTYVARTPDTQSLYLRLSRALNKLGEMFAATQDNSGASSERLPLSTNLDAAALDLIAAGAGELVAAMVERHLQSSGEM